MERIERVILDTDIGDDVDDAYALALLMGSPEVKLEAVTINTGEQLPKARLARKLLDLAGLSTVPVYTGAQGKYPGRVKEQTHWAADYASAGAIGEGAIEQLVRRAAAEPGEITVIAIGPLTNIKLALEKDPNFGRNLRWLVVMGGSIVHGYDFGNKCAEGNIHCDIAASQAVFASGANIILVPLDATARQQITPKQMAELAVADNALCDALLELTTLCEYVYPTMHDPRACAVVLTEELGRSFSARVEVSDAGLTNIVPGDPNCRVVLEPKIAEFFALMWPRLVCWEGRQ